MARITVESDNKKFVFKRKFNSEDLYDIVEDWLYEQLTKATEQDEKGGK